MEDEDICETVYEKIGQVEKILDIGCGEGYLVNCLADQIDRKVVGCDISDEGFDKAHRKCKDFGTCGYIDCMEVDAHELSEKFTKSTFDAITFIYSLHHMDRPVEVLEKVRELLKENGKVVIGDFW